MIFVTVGTQLPFNRLISAVDTWAKNHPEVEIIAQIGPTDFQPLNMKYSSFLSPDEAAQRFVQASLVVSHAGMGSILTALRYRKPILILPRLASLSEHRNDHQLATAKWLCNKPGVTVAWDESEIAAKLDSKERLSVGEGISDYANPDLIKRLQSYFASV